ncbi:MAG: ribonuclease HII [Gammaproteobacteria bacterium]|nr:ribonuclease HII [Gammaproteobacteria bacterium]
MALDLDKLSIQEIRNRFLLDDAPVSGHVLQALRRDRRQGAQQIYVSLKKRHERERSERVRLDGMLNFERVLWKSGVQHIAGVDEVGMGPLAGPVVAAAVVFAPGTVIDGVDDSKRLDPAMRTVLADVIRTKAAGVGVGLATVEEIDTLNVYHAGLLAMRRAVEALPTVPQHVLVDARTIPGLSMPQNPFTKGDGLNFSIAAASIVAKAHRDRLMSELHERYPEYGFQKHKGYGTPEHQAAIRRYGPCVLHRMSYPFIQELRGQYSTRFYEYKEQLANARTPAAVRAVERTLKADGVELTEHETRKLKLLFARRWKAL